MLRRMALVVFLLILSGAAAIFAAGRFGIELPWTIAVKKEPAETAARQPASKDEGAAGKAADVARDTAAALGGDDKDPLAGGKVEVDISRISPDGASVIAGRAAPNTYVTVMENGKPAGTVKADENGEWSLATEHKFASTNPSLSYDVSATPPPEPEKPAAVATVAPPSPDKPAKTAGASAAAGEVMRKFENLVAEARKEAEAEKSAQANGSASPAPAENATPPDQSAAATPAPTQSTSVAEATAPSSAPATASSSAGSSAANAEESRAAPIPVPIMFVYNEATLTPEGEHAAKLLLEYLQLKHLAAVELTGHADERGTGEYNLDLSRERLDTVSRILRDGGYGGGLNLVPKGETEPYMGVDRTKYHGDALYQLDRRVELRVLR